MIKYLIQPYSKQFIYLACSVCTVKYQTSVFCINLARSIATKKPRSDKLFHSTDLTLGQQPLNMTRYRLKQVQKINVS